jgi:uncharacterized membrane protein YhaH (DUF805 family)
LYGATLGQAVSRFFRNYARFSGRASGSEYWWVQLSLPVVIFLYGLFIVVAFSVAEDLAALGPASMLPALAFVLACMVPNWALLVRRLHDADLSGWMVLLTLVPYIGFVLQIVFCVLPSNPHGERFDRR